MNFWVIKLMPASSSILIIPSIPCIRGRVQLLREINGIYKTFIMYYFLQCFWICFLQLFSASEMYTISQKKCFPITVLTLFFPQYYT